MQFRFSTFFEYIDSPTESYVRNGARLERLFDLVRVSPGGQRQPVTFSMRRQFAEDMLGANVVMQSGAARYVSRLTPFAAPATPTAFLPAGASVVRSAYYATGMPTVTLLPGGRGDGTGTAVAKQNNPADQLPGPGATGVAMGPVARCKVVFDALPWAVKEDAAVVATSPPAGGTASPIIGFPDEGDAYRAGGMLGSRYITEYLDYGGRIITLTDYHNAAGGAVVYTVDPADSPVRRQIVYPQPFSEPSIIVHLIWRQVPAAARPQKAIQSLQGRVNECDFGAWKKGCLLFKSAKEEFYENHLGCLEYELDYAFQFLPHQKRYDANGNRTSNGDFLGHNSVLHRRSDGSIDYAVMDASPGTGGTDPSTNNPPNPVGDFTALFRPDQS